MRTIDAKDWNGTDTAWLWTECGSGELLPVRYIQSDWWIVTGRGWATNSWCCCPDTRLYVGTDAEAKETAKLLQVKLADRRESWNKGIYA